MNVFDAVFSRGAMNIAKGFVQATNRSRDIVTQVLGRMNEWTAAGWSAIPYKRAIGMGSAVGVGLAVILSEPAPALNMPQGFVQPDFSSGSGGQGIPENVHPMPPSIGQPTINGTASAGNRGMIRRGFRASITAQAMQVPDPTQLNNQIRGALGPRTRVNMRLVDERSSLTSQHMADILSNG